MQLAGNLASCGAALRNKFDPTQVVEHEGWRRARRQVLERITAKVGPIAVLGDAGTGKTALLRHIASLWERDGYQVRLTDRVGLALDFAEDRILLLDDADKLAKPVLERLLQQFPACLSTGLPSFAQSLQGSRVNINFVDLAPLSPGETRSFVVERLTKAGWTADHLTDDALERMVSHSAGVPRIINLLLRSAVLIAAGDRADRVTGAHVDKAVAIRGEIDGPVAAGAGLSGASSEPQAAATDRRLDSEPAAEAHQVPAEPSSAIGPCGQGGQPAVNTPDFLSEDSSYADASYDAFRDHPEADGKAASAATDQPEKMRLLAIALANAPPNDLNKLFRPIHQTAGAGSLGVDLRAAKNLSWRVKIAGAAIVCTLLVGVWMMPPHHATQSDGPRPTATVSSAAPDSVDLAGAVMPNAKTDNVSAKSSELTAATATSIPSETNKASDPISGSEAPERIEKAAAPQSFRSNFVSMVEPSLSPQKPLPRGAATRVVLTYRRADSRAEAKALKLAARLRNLGLLADPVAGPPAAPMGQILYFFSEDHDTAVDLRKSLAAKYSDPKLVNVSSKTLSTRPGTVEVSVLP